MAIFFNYNLVTIWLSVIAGIFLAIFIFRKTKDREDLAFGWFWLMHAGLWLVASLEYLAYFRGWQKFYFIMYVSVSIFTVAVIIPLVFHICLKVFQKVKWSYGIATIIGLLGLVYIISIYFGGGPHVIALTNFGPEYNIPRLAQIIFYIIFGIGTVLLMYDFISRLIKWFLTKKMDQAYKFFTTLAIFIYIMAGLYDVYGVKIDWLLFMIRILYLLAALIAYLAYTGLVRPVSDNRKNQLYLK